MTPEYNTAQNVRWGTLAMVACSLYTGNMVLAFLFALTLFLAYVAEAVPHPDWRSWGSLIVTVWTTALLVAFAVSLAL